MPVGRVHIAAVCISQFKLHTGQRFMGLRIQFADHQAALGTVVKPKCLSFPCFDLDGFRRGVQHIPFQRLGFPRDDRGPRLQPIDHDAAVFIRDEFAVAVAYHCPGAVCYQERDSLQRCSSTLNVFFDDQAGSRCVFDDHHLGVSPFPNDYIGGGRVDHIPRRRFDLRDHIRPRC